MKTLILGLGLVIPCFAAGPGGGSTVKMAATFVGIVLAILLRALFFGDKGSKRKDVQG
ncbi:MAG TPA: hypothetical protein VK752_14105 [Bryobacteraceae bacterium]|jgi:hypothetical protein|nr:hypothetical protein [Bryobacteraceae bacterium]